MNLRTFLVPVLLLAACAGEPAELSERNITPADASPQLSFDATAGEHLRVYLATYGPGEAVWEKFGHNAIWVQDTRTGETTSYNWGTFDFNDADFVPRLVRGGMLYWLAVRDAQREANEYAYFNRSITLQELALSPAQKAELKAFVDWNAREENRFYNYHYYRDNCSTRVRDVIDRVLRGELARQLQVRRSEQTFRSHSLRLAANAPLAYTGMELGLADSVDHPLTAWEEAFVPMELMRHLRTVQVRDDAGALRPLVASEQAAFVGLPEPARKPNSVPIFLALGVAVGAAFLLLGRYGRRSAEPRTRPALRRAAAWSWAVLAGVWSLLAGLFGTFVLLLWVATGHTFTYGNENLLQANPLPLLLVVLAPATALGARWARRPAFIIAAFVASLSLLGLMAKPLPGFDQMNHDILALMLPGHLGLALALLYRSRDERPST